MKLFRITLSTILLMLLVCCTNKNPESPEPPKPPVPPRPDIEKIAEWLRTIPGVYSVEELKTEKYKKHFLILFNQLLDPKNPGAGTFLQRVFLSHEDFDNPVVFETEGYNAQSSMTKTFKTELTNRYKANRIVVEHRYSGMSTPVPHNWQYSGYNWNYLTCENAAADLHAVRMALGVGYTGKWIATGASKGGTNAMSYIMYYPTDVAAAVAYVGPICNSTTDTRFINHMKNVGTNEMRQKIVDFQREVLTRRDIIQPLFFKKPASPTNSKEYMSNDQRYELSIVSYAHIAWQRAKSIDDIPAADDSDEDIIEYLIKEKVFGSRKPKPFFDKDEDEDEDELNTFMEHYIQQDDFDNYSTKADGKPDLTSTHYYVQTMNELGRFAYYIEPLADLIPNHKTWTINTVERFIVPANASNIKFSDRLYSQMTQWLQNSDPRLICVYGEYDPWTAAAPDKAYFAGKTNMVMYIEKAGSHSAKIQKLASSDKQQAWAKLDSWIK